MTTLEGCKALMDLINDGVLVRNCSDDHQSKWVLKAASLVKTLAEVQRAIDAEEAKSGD